MVYARFHLNSSSVSARLSHHLDIELIWSGTSHWSNLTLLETGQDTYTIHSLRFLPVSPLVDSIILKQFS